VHLLTADTRGRQDAIDSQLGMAATRVAADGGSNQKAAYVRSLGRDRVCAIGNGSVDTLMLSEAALAIAVLGDEGLAVDALTAAQVVTPSICSALDLLLDPVRTVATLRR
jgi:soluble P-type ATPase